jgi:hypothetical protein
MTEAIPVVNRQRLIEAIREAQLRQMPTPAEYLADALLGADVFRDAKAEALPSKADLAAPVVSRERIAEALANSDVIEAGYEYLVHAQAFDVADVLIAADVFRDEATVKAEALEEAATSRRGITKTRGDVVDKYLRNRAAALRAGEPS